ncbi:MAG: TetR/AcrR family transcriptional regulator [Spirochaetota bacterium]
MARRKEFDRRQALEKAMEVFWSRGYEATTMTDLRLAMGIGRQSLYDTFGDKDKLFAEALASYTKLNDENVKDVLKEQDGIKAVRTLLEARVKMLSSGHRRGCLMMNSCVELALHDEAVANQLKKGLATMHREIERALARALEQETLPKKVSIAETADFVLAQIAGMVVLSKTGASHKQLQNVADKAMAAIES